MKDESQTHEPTGPSLPSDAERLDGKAHATIARLTGGLSPTALALAWTDWAMHLVGSPSKQLELQSKALEAMAHAAGNSVRGALEDSGAPGPDLAADHRFRDQPWARYPYDAIARNFLLMQDWWDSATTGLRGVERHHENMVHAGARQWLDAISPSNWPMLNPVVVDRTLEEKGMNLLRGARNLGEDMLQQATGDRVTAEAFQPGKNVAVTPGEVVHRNRLMELIRYRPAGDTVQAEPLLIVPAWIMKYYILDLSPGNSLIGYLVERGFEVYAISWLNPGDEDSDLGMDDYVRLGVLDALDTIRQIVPGQKVQALGYCLGGTLLSLSAAAMARDGRDDLASMTLLAAQVDFTEAGEITLFINDSQVAFLEDMMHQQGYLKANQMAGAFEMLRTNDLIWARMIREYLLGDRLPMNDLMAWNADSTRMPARMHSEYLRHLFLENQLALGQFEVGGRPVSLSDIAVPIFAVGTETDHVAPWRSAWKIGHLADAPVTFLLTNGGHNAGIISEPGHPHRHYRVGAVSGHVQRADDWFAAHDPKDGSWWPVWADWLLRQSSGTRPAKAKPPRSLGAAPGTYVFG